MWNSEPSFSPFLFLSLSSDSLLQKVSEKVGGAEGTKLDDDFKEMEKVIYLFLCDLTPILISAKCEEGEAQRNSLVPCRCGFTHLKVIFVSVITKITRRLKWQFSRGRLCARILLGSKPCNQWSQWLQRRRELAHFLFRCRLNSQVNVGSFNCSRTGCHPMHRFENVP